MIARKAAPASTGSTVQIGKLAISVTGGNLGAWAAGGDVPDVLEVTSRKGRHSAQLARLLEAQTRIDLLTLKIAAANESGELDLGSLAFEISHGRVKSYDVDGKTESWAVAGFDKVHRVKITHTVS